MYKKGNFFLLILLLCTYFVNAQKAITSAGVNVVSMSGNMSFAVGQIDYTNTGNSVSTHILSKGVLQIYNKFPNVLITPVDNSNKIIVWPNPVINELFFKIEGKEGSELSYQVIDINGHLLEKGKLFAMKSFIEMQKYPSGIYIINIFYSNKKSVKFKIIKL